MRPVSSFALVLLVAAGSGCAEGSQLSSGSGASGAGNPDGGAGPTTVTSGGGEGPGGSTGQGGTGADGGGGAGAGTTTASAAGGEGGQGGSAQGGGGSGGQTTSAGAGGPGHECGNAVLEDDEDCDGPELGEHTCESLGFLGGTLACTNLCKLDDSGCTNCGNGSVEPQLGEECDFDAMGKPLVLTTCAGLGFAGSSANPGCDPTCHYDTAPCLCGNGTIDPGEGCDGSDFGGKTCATFGFTAGSLSCSQDCEINATGCFQSPTCGNGMIDAGEQCDGQNLNGQSCLTQGFPGGAITCTAGCQLDTGGCFKCGNGVVEPGEQCDDSNTIPGDGCSATCQTESMTCDPDGTYTITQGGPISYSCCSGLVGVNVSGFIFSGDGATILASPSNPVPLSGAATTCPAGSFSNIGSIPGGCTETYHVSGSFTGPNTWEGLFNVTFTGSDCSCFGGLLGAPCINQVYPITATK